MLINSLRLYDRILQGLRSPDTVVRDAAISCLSFLVVRLKHEQLALPEEVEVFARRLPEGGST